jgi:hypothetical protein
MGSARCVHAQALELPARDQRADACDLVKRVLGEARAERLAHFGLRGASQVKQSGGRRQIGDRL